MICMGVSASETHSRKNAGVGVAEATARVIRMAWTARGEGTACRSRCSPRSGAASRARCRASACSASCSRFLDAGLQRLSLADTAGHAVPDDVERPVRRACARWRRSAELACHFHDTYGLALANCYAALRAGVTSFESSVRRAGRVPVHRRRRRQHLHRGPGARAAAHRDRRTDIDLGALIDVARDVAAFLGRELPGAVHKVAARSREPQCGESVTACGPLLAGVRVLDLTNVLSGPFARCTSRCSGAEVIKIENPKAGDLARKLGNVPRLNQELMGTSFLAQNANKKSLTLNLKQPRRATSSRSSWRTADVLVENFRPGVMDAAGLSGACSRS